MPDVLTYKEYSGIIATIRPLVLRSVKSYLSKMDLGKRFKVDDLNRVRYLVYLRKLIVNDWEQSYFTNEEYSNYLSDADIRNLFSKILKLTRCDVEFFSEPVKPVVLPPEPTPDPPTESQFIWNRTNLKSDSSPSVGSRNISVTTTAGTSTYGSSSFIEITPQTVNIKQAGSDDLVLISGINTVFITGGNVDNFVDTTLLGQVINIYNNNEEPPIEGFWEDGGEWDDEGNWDDEI